MKFTKYIWDLYRNSIEGRNEINFFKESDLAKIAKRFEFGTKFKVVDRNQNLQIFCPYEVGIEALKCEKVENFIEAKQFFQRTVIDFVKGAKFNEFIQFIDSYSTALYHRFPNFFVPFYYKSESFPDFILMCDNLGISLPPMPSRFDWEKRTWYYFELCEALHKFRLRYEIDSEEFPALLYSFGLKTIEKTEEGELPKPSRIYFLGAGASGGKDNLDFKFVDNLDNKSVGVWGAGNLNIKKGDLVLMYCVSPRKYLHSIWRALEDSYIDPFRFYYYSVKVGFPQKIEPIGYYELRENLILKENSTVKSNMQGMNGRPLTVKEYSELIKMIEAKGQSTKSLPKLPVYERDIDYIENERDVELQLIEPLLRDLGYQEKDWIRQLPLRMGRQTKYYPDYAIKANLTKGKEKAKIILEAKYSINSDKQLQDAYNQARSYGLRLQSGTIILADMDYVWIYGKTNGDFNSVPTLKMHWNELTDSDNLYHLKEMLK